ncbi:hypothetical protein [Providencia rettgeri]|uniref:hypothetical protein n=1 Tax=Providencia rettgeri TaxID=587 RepID=UPI00235E12AE|nr:hypothetical protein [Providencia rettgeri]
MWVQKLVAFILISVTAIMVGIILTVYEDNNFNMISLIGGALLSAFFPFLFSDENKKG